MSADLRLVYLGHLSRDCNRPELAHRVVGERLCQISATHLPAIIDRLQNQATIMILGVLAGSFFQQVGHALATTLFI